MLQGTYFILVDSMPCKYRRTGLLILRMVFAIEHILPYSMLHVYPQLGVRFLADSNSWNVSGTTSR